MVLVEGGQVWNTNPLFVVGNEEENDAEESSTAEAVEGAVEDCTNMTEVPELDEIREKAHRLCREYLRGSWRKIQTHEMTVCKISGGLSNLLYYCALPTTLPPSKGEPARVLLRLYGQVHGQRALQGLIAESVIFTMLSESQRGPRLYGVFPGGRLEEYIPARPLVTSEMSDPALSLLIAEKLAQIHQMSVPINKEPRWLWDTMDSWMSAIEEFMAQTTTREQFKLMIKQVKKYDLEKELDWLKKFLMRIKSPVVFCHNDMQEGNILLRSNGPTERELVIIDYEYCSYNYRAFDLANHFCEWVYDYSNESHPYFWAKQHTCPTREQQETFISTYLETIARESGHPEMKVEQSQVSRLRHEVDAFTLASHFFWGLWSVINASTSTIHFDYWEYGKERFLRYFERKAELLEAEELMFAEEQMNSLDSL